MAEPHPLLAQVPLTVSPFVSLPTATTLPYTYKTLPSTLPPSSTEDRSGISNKDNGRPKFIMSSSGQAVAPDDIIASCHALQTHLNQMQEKAKASLKDWEVSIKERELAEKRRVAPGWLDREEKILQPLRTPLAQEHQPSHSSLLDQNLMDDTRQEKSSNQTSEGEQLDIAFGRMKVT